MNSSRGSSEFSSTDAAASFTKEENSWLYPLLFFLLNLVVKSFLVTKVSYDLDESWHTFFSQKPIGEVLTIAGTDPNGPFYNLLLHFWIQLFGISEFSTRYLSVILSSATAPLLFLLGKKYFNTPTGVIGALIFSFSNLHFFFSHIARVYALICFLSALSFLLFIALIKTRRYSVFIFLFIINTFLLYTHLTTSFFLVAEGLAAWLFFSETKKGTGLVILAQCIAVLLFVPWVLWTPYYHQPLHGIWLDPPGWSNIKQTLIDFSGSENILYLFTCILLIALIIKVRYLWSTQGKLMLVLFLWFFIPMACSFVFSQRFVPVFWTKYVMVSSLGLYLFMGYSISFLVKDKRIMAGITVLVLLLALPAMGKREYTAEAWKSVVQEVKRRKTDKTLVIVSPAYQDVSFCYYYNKDYFRKTDSMVELLKHDKIILGNKKEIILRQPTNYDKIILLTSHEEIVSPDTLIDFLTKNFHMTFDTAFSDIRMYCFSKKQSALLLVDDMESDAIAYQPGKIIEKEFARSGKNVCITDAGNPYSTTFENRVMGFSAASTYIKPCGWVYYGNENTDCVLVITFEKEERKGSYVYESIKISEFGPPKTWVQVCGKIKIPAEASPSDLVKFYFWNKSANPVYIDDMEVTEISDSAH